jgi:hypothetical protein
MHAIPRLMRLNGMPMELRPSMEFGKVGEVELLDIVEFIKAASTGGMQLFPSMELENHLRTILGFPPIDEQEFEEREAANQADKQAERDAKARQPAMPQGNGQDEQNGDEQMSRAHAALLEAARRVVARGA